MQQARFAPGAVGGKRWESMEPAVVVASKVRVVMLQ